jgi:hypothetical protein
MLHVEEHAVYTVEDGLVRHAQLYEGDKLLATIDMYDLPRIIKELSRVRDNKELGEE